VLALQARPSVVTVMSCSFLILSSDCCKILYAVSSWMNMLLPLALERGTCIITNMGASKNFLMLHLMDHVTIVDHQKIL